MNIALWVGSVAAIGIAGCTHTYVTPLSNHSYPAKPPDCSLHTFMDASRVGRPYTDIAIISHSTQSGAGFDKDATTITEALREQACALGADGMIIRSLQPGHYGDPGEGEAMAIRFKSTAPTNGKLPSWGQAGK